MGDGLAADGGWERKVRKERNERLRADGGFITACPIAKAVWVFGGEAMPNGSACRRPNRRKGSKRSCATRRFVCSNDGTSPPLGSALRHCTAAGYHEVDVGAVVAADVVADVVVMPLLLLLMFVSSQLLPLLLL